MRAVFHQWTQDLQGAADRLDPETIPVRFDVSDYLG
jgi:hypothetical protein